MSLLFLWKNTNTWVQAQTEVTNKRVQSSALPYLETLFVLILCAFQLLCQPSLTFLYQVLSRAVGVPRPLQSALVTANSSAVQGTCVWPFGIWILDTCLSTVPPATSKCLYREDDHPPNSEVHSAYAGVDEPAGWRGGTEPTHQEGIHGSVSQEILLVASALQRKALALFFLLPQFKAVFPCPLSLMRDERLKTCPLGIGAETVYRGTYLHLAPEFLLGRKLFV